MRTDGQLHHFEIAAAAPYVATLLLADGMRLSLALPGIGERVLASPLTAGQSSRLELIPPSSAWSAEPLINPAARAALAQWQAMGGEGGLALRHEKGLGGETGLGDVTAAVAAGAVAGAALGQGQPDPAKLAPWLANLTVDTKILDSNTDGPGPLAATLGGGAVLHGATTPRPVAANADLHIVVILPGQGAAEAPTGAGAEPNAETIRRALIDGQLGTLRTNPSNSAQLDEPWRAAWRAAEDAGAAWSGVAAGGRVLVALVLGKGNATVIKTTAIDAFAAHGVWSRGRAGPLDRRGAWSAPAELQP